VKLLLVNGSPRRASANSRILLDGLEERLGGAFEYRKVEAASGVASAEDLDADFIVLAFPLYIDCLHSRLLSWLLSYESLARAAAASGGDSAPARRRVGLVAVANNGFYEGAQNESALAIVANFCARAGIVWRGGFGIGTGEMIGELKAVPAGASIKRPVSAALDRAAARVSEAAPARSPANEYSSHGLPWRAFELTANLHWLREAGAKGVGWRAMVARPFGAP